MSCLVTFKRRALIAGGDDYRSWSCDLKDRIFFLCWCRTRWSAPCADGGCLGSPGGAASYSGGGGPGSLGAGVLCGGSGLEISGDVALSDNLGSPSVAALCGSLQTPGAVASCDSLGALRTTPSCADQQEEGKPKVTRSGPHHGKWPSGKVALGPVPSGRCVTAGTRV
uniref:DUF3778 domain-containing protein n=1 Tax=Oryza glumipatula TaxID=40148 RepID=A0A0D9Z614_9ORYZ